MPFRPVAFADGLVRMGETRVRAIVFAVWAGWLAFVTVLALGLSLLTWLLQGPWWLYWAAGAMALLLFAPVFLIGLIAMATLREWSGRVREAARVEAAVFDEAPSGPVYDTRTSDPKEKAR